MKTKRLIQQFKDLVSIDSESGYEREIADYLIQKFKSLNIPISEDDTKIYTGYGAGNLYVNIPGDFSMTPIYFTVHMDTVTPGKNIEPILENGYLRSKGETILGADDKAGIAALIEMVHIIKDENLNHAPIELVITVGEETGMIGAKAFDASQLNAKYGYAIDGPGCVGTIINQAPTKATIETHIYGKSAHAGLAPEEGVSAVKIASQAISRMRLGRIDEKTTANVGHIKGGGATNVVPDYVFLKSEARSLQTESLKQQVSHMIETFEDVAYTLGGQVKITTETMYPPIDIEVNNPVITRVTKALNTLKMQPHILSIGGGSDANVFHGKGIDTVILGLNYKDIHTTNECITVQSLENITKLLVEIIKISE